MPDLSNTEHRRGGARRVERQQSRRRPGRWRQGHHGRRRGRQAGGAGRVPEYRQPGRRGPGGQEPHRGHGAAALHRRGAERFPAERADGSATADTGTGSCASVAGTRKQLRNHGPFGRVTAPASGDGRRCGGWRPAAEWDRRPGVLLGYGNSHIHHRRHRERGIMKLIMPRSNPDESQPLGAAREGTRLGRIGRVLFARCHGCRGGCSREIMRPADCGVSPRGGRAGASRQEIAQCRKPKPRLRSLLMS